jgi:hypothetical protein
MHVPGLRSPYAKVGGLVYFGRMLDKIRLHDAGKLPSDYNIGTESWWDFDSRCTRFLGIKYEKLVKRVRQGGTDLALLKWCFKEGRKPSEEDLEIWNTFLQKRGWNDGTSESVQEAKAAARLGNEDQIATWFDLFDADERQNPKLPKTSAPKKRRA